MGEIEARTRSSSKQVRKGVAKARAKDSLRALDKLTDAVDGELRIRQRPPLIVPVEELLPEGETHDLEEVLRQVLDAYRGTPPGRPPAPARRATASATWPARWSASAASAPAPGSCC